MLVSSPCGKFSYPGTVIIKILKPSSGEEHHKLVVDGERPEFGWEAAGSFRAYPTPSGPPSKPADGPSSAFAAAGLTPPAPGPPPVPLGAVGVSGVSIGKGSSTGVAAFTFWAYQSPGTPETVKYTVYEQRGSSRCGKLRLLLPPQVALVSECLCLVSHLHSPSTCTLPFDGTRVCAGSRSLQETSAPCPAGLLVCPSGPYQARMRRLTSCSTESRLWTWMRLWTTP